MKYNLLSKIPININKIKPENLDKEIIRAALKKDEGIKKVLLDVVKEEKEQVEELQEGKEEVEEMLKKRR